MLIDLSCHVYRDTIDLATVKMVDRHSYQENYPCKLDLSAMHLFKGTYRELEAKYKDKVENIICTYPIVENGIESQVLTYMVYEGLIEKDKPDAPRYKAGIPQPVPKIWESAVYLVPDHPDFGVEVHISNYHNAYLTDSSLPPIDTIQDHEDEELKPNIAGSLDYHIAVDQTACASK